MTRVHPANPVYDTTKRHPRTLQEAFGPHATRQVVPPPEPMHPHDRIVIAAAAIAAAALAIVAIFS